MPLPDEISLFLDYSEDIRTKQHHLDFWDQQGKMQSITFHLKDSIPYKKRLVLNNLKDSFLKLNPKPWNKETHTRYRNLISKQVDNLLDNGLGSCLLRYPDLRKILENTLWYYNDIHYFLHSYVIMPNHVHLMLNMKEDYKLEKIMGQIKRYTANQINKATGRKGSLWVKENYCRLIRNWDHYKIFEGYIKNNPKNLREDE